MPESASEKKKEDWMNSKWRPMMGWMYMLVCFMDFVGFPVLWSLIQAYDHGNVTSQWQPLTLQGAGLFHIAMGAVIGISAYGRTQEKLNGAEGGGLGSFGPGVGTTYVPPSGTTTPTGGFGNASTTPTAGFSSGSTAFGSAPAGGFGAPAAVPATSGFGSASPAPATTPAPATGGFGSGFNSGSGATPAPQAPTVTETVDVTVNVKETGVGSATPNTPVPVTGQVAPGFGGKLGPVPADDPIL